MAKEPWIWVKIKVLAGTCAAAADFDDIKASVGDAREKVDDALKIGQFLQKDSRIFNKLQKANKGLGAVSDSLDKAGEICLDLRAVNQICHSILFLNKPNIIQDDPQAAADSFDRMFQGFGRLCRFLPPPADEWGKFFEDFNLVGNYQKNMMTPHFNAAHAAYRSGE